MLGVPPTVAHLPVPEPAVLGRTRPAGAPRPRFAPRPAEAPALARAALPCWHRCARWARAEGFGPGDRAALLTRDPARATAIRQGLAAAGVSAVLLDPDAAGADLAAALAACGARVAIVETALAGAYRGLMGRLDAYPAVWWDGPGADFARFDLALVEEDVAALS